MAGILGVSTTTFALPRLMPLPNVQNVPVLLKFGLLPRKVRAQVTLEETAVDTIPVPTVLPIQRVVLTTRMVVVTRETQTVLATHQIRTRALDLPHAVSLGSMEVKLSVQIKQKQKQKDVTSTRVARNALAIRLAVGMLKMVPVSLEIPMVHATAAKTADAQALQVASFSGSMGLTLSAQIRKQKTVDVLFTPTAQSASVIQLVVGMLKTAIVSLEMTKVLVIVVKMGTAAEVQESIFTGNMVPMLLARARWLRNWVATYMLIAAHVKRI